MSKAADEKRAAYYRGVRACVQWLHLRAAEMNDPHAKALLNSAAFSLGVDKPDPALLPEDHP